MLNIKNKKATEAGGVLIIIIITVVTFFLIALTLREFWAKSEDKEAELLCHNSIMLRTATTANAFGTDIKLAPVLCKTIDKKIYGEREEIKEQMAYLMARCWWMFNEGRQDDSLSSDNVAKLLGFDNNENKCFLCYTVVVDEKEIGGGPIEAPEMFHYLVQTDHQKVRGLKYMDYLQSYGGPGKANVMAPIYPQNAYGVVFMSKSKDDAKFGKVDAGAGILGALATAGTIACIILEPCGIVTAIGAGAVAVTAIGYEALHATNVLLAKANFYKEERAVSMVTLDDLKGIEAGKCAVKDMAGE